MPGLRFILGSWHRTLMDVRIFPIPKRKHPPTIKANEARGYEETRSAKFEETRSGNIDFGIQGQPHSTVQKEEYGRREVVKKLIYQFDTHPNRDSLMEDLNHSVQRKVEGVDQQHG